MLRKLIAIALLALFGMPFASSLFALQAKSELRLPACCRRNGKHHCIMSTAERMQAQDDKPALQQVPEQCPYCSAAVLPAHHPVGHGVSVGQAIYASLVSHPAITPQTESKFRTARERTRGKRGPPESTILL